jgi:YesN/AraC family two-component response regulator
MEVTTNYLDVMVVDDEHLARKGIISVFPWEQHGMRVVAEATDGVDALRVLRESHVDLLFTDLTMPGMDGIELCERVRETRPEIEIVILTCHQDFEYTRQALRLGVIDYIVKTQLETPDLGEHLQRIRATFLRRSHSEELSNSTRGLQEGDSAHRIRRAAAAAAADVASVSEEKLADQAGMSRSYFSQRFGEVMGCSFRDFLREEKMKQARLMLGSTSRPVRVIAHEVGFQDVKYFSRTFRETTGLTPSEFRSRAHRYGS